MSSASSLPYRLRPNKAVDRELFLNLLGRLGAALKIESYRYVGLGGPFLEDFRLIHARLGLSDLVCVESVEAVHRRQEFNRPVNCIKCVHETLDDYIDGAEFDKPVIIWFDYTDPGAMTNQIERFAQAVSEVPLNSVLRITLNANPSSLGKPDPDEVATPLDPDSNLPTEKDWRLSRFKERMGQLFPSGLSADGMTFKRFGGSVLEALSLAVDGEVLKLPDRKIIWALATHYADGQPMVTATLIVTDSTEVELEALIGEWQFASKPEAPLKLDMPALSTLERLTMETDPDPKVKMGYKLPKSDMGEDPFDAFRQFYRMYPHFARVDL